MGSNKRPDPPPGAEGAPDPDATRVLPRTPDATMPVTPSMVLEPVPDDTLQVTHSMLLAAGVGETMALTPDMVVNDASIVMAPTVVERAVAVVRLWHVALNAGDVDTLVATCADDVQIAGAHGGRGLAAVREWLTRTGFSATPTRWFCGGEGHVVVEQQARWRYRDGMVAGVVASAFVVRGGRIHRHERFDELATAMTMYGLRAVHELTARR